MTVQKRNGWNCLKEEGNKPMKQHITVEQLRELSDKGMERLHNLVFKGKKFVGFHNAGPLLLSIGQMIEFLDDHYGNQTIKYCSALLIDNQSINTRDGGRWLAMKASNHKDRKYFSDELCDALWSAIKEELENK
jgi:hypothetical protein